MPAGDRRRLLAAFALGAALAAVIVLASSRADPDRTAYGDGLIYRYVAAHLSTPPAELHPVVAARGPSLRYGRIGLPAAIWVASAGRPGAMAYAQPVVIVLAAGAASAAAAALFPGAGPLAAALPFLAPGFPLSIAGGFAEVLAVALGLWAVAFAVRDRWWAASLLLGASILTKENAAAIVAGLALWLLLRRRGRPLAALAAGLVPVAVWYLVVRGRFGHIPPLDPYLRETTTTVATPIVAVVRSFTDAYSARAMITAALHLAAGALVVAIARTSLFALLGSVAAVQLLSAGPFGWRFIGDASRISAIFQLFVVLAVVAWRKPAWAAPGSVPALGTAGPAPAGTVPVSVRG